MLIILSFGVSKIMLEWGGGRVLRDHMSDRCCHLSSHILISLKELDNPTDDYACYELNCIPHIHMLKP